MSSKFSCPFPPVRPEGPGPESAQIDSTIKTLGLQKHIEGGYFLETDRDTTQIPNPFLGSATSSLATSQTQSETRDTSTTIYYLLTPNSPIGHFHRNRGRTVHVHHHGRARYILIHADETPARIETFDVGPNITSGEKLQWIVEGGKYKCSFLLPHNPVDPTTTLKSSSSATPVSEKGCLITEVVTPGFEYADHDFLTRKDLAELVEGGEESEVLGELVQLLRKGERPTEEELRTKVGDRR